MFSYLSSRSGSNKALVKAEPTQRAPVPATASKLLKQLQPLLPAEIKDKMLNLLNIVVIGIQDAGKSSSLNSIVGVPKLMPTAHGNRSTKLTTRIHVVPGQTTIEIKAPRPGGASPLIANHPLDHDFAGIVQQMQEETIEAYVEAGMSRERIGKEVELNIRVPAAHVCTGMTEFEFQLVDTQGMTDADDVKDVLRALIADAHNIFLAVVPATHPSTSTDQAIKLLSEHPEAAKRTITVLTKLDAVETINLQPNVQLRILGPCPEGDSKLTASTPVVGLINSNRLGEQLDAQAWCDTQLAAGSMTDPAVKNYIGVRPVLEVVEKLQFTHVTTAVLPNYSRRLQALKSQKCATQRDLPSLNSTMRGYNVQDKLLDGLDDLMQEAPDVVRGALIVGSQVYRGFQQYDDNGTRHFIEKEGVNRYNDTTGYEGFVSSLTGVAAAETAKLVRRAVQAAFHMTGLPRVVAAVEAHLVALAHQVVQPMLATAREDILKLPRVASSATQSCEARCACHKATIDAAIEEPAVAAAKAAILHLFEYIKNSGFFMYWCIETLAETYDEDKPAVVAERERLDTVLDQCNAAIGTIHTMMEKTSSSVGINSSIGGGSSGFTGDSSSGFNTSGGGSNSMRAPAVSVKREYEDRERDYSGSGSGSGGGIGNGGGGGGGSSSKRSRKSSIDAAAAAAAASSTPTAAVVAPAPRPDAVMQD